MSTTVKNPVHRIGYPQFKVCKHCLGRFTALGLSRHWDHCAVKKLFDQKYQQGAKK